MANLFKPKIEDKKPPVLPERSAEEIQMAAAEQRQRFFGSQGGRASAILTGGGGASVGTGAVSKLFGNAVS